MIDRQRREVRAFDRDAQLNAGYLYSTNARLSSLMANRRMTDAILQSFNFRGKRVLDIGCGDGTYTVDLYDRGQPASIQGFDLAHEAVKIARQKIQGRKISLAVHGAYDLPYLENSFEIACFRGVLHHLDRPICALREALRVSPVLVVVEPNGYNPILKCLERFSRYHLEHHEKSYRSRMLDQWILQLGGEVRRRKWAGLIPMFCPDWFARCLKKIEPLVEELPIIKNLGCAVYVFVAMRRMDPPTHH